MRLAERTRYGIGGRTPRLGLAGSEAELREALSELSGASSRTLGGGANVLVADRGVRRPVLVLDGEFETLRVEPDAIEAGAAARLPALAAAARREAREGFHFLEAVPGTVGGGLRMNAGSRDEWMWHHVDWAEAMTPEGEVVRVDATEADAGYRTIGLPESWVFLRGRFLAPAGDAEGVSERHLSFRAAKVASQVYELPSVGSTWKNPGPPYGSAWEVVDRVGMRGARRGAAQISDRHANFIVNLGGARAGDVLGLMAETRRRAHEDLGARLTPEICLWGFEPEELSSVGAEAA